MARVVSGGLLNCSSSSHGTLEAGMGR